MPLPVLAGLPWLAGVIASAFAGLFAWFMTFVTKRFAIVAAGVVIIVSLTSSLYAALAALVSTLALTLPPTLVGNVGLFVPSNLGACVSIYVSARLLRWAYDWNVKIIQMKML